MEPNKYIVCYSCYSILQTSDSYEDLYIGNKSRNFSSLAMLALYSHTKKKSLYVLLIRINILLILQFINH
jgi:hypothetical protein